MKVIVVEYAPAAFELAMLARYATFTTSLLVGTVFENRVVVEAF
jgi:hypothetical protein